MSQNATKAKTELTLFYFLEGHNSPTASVLANNPAHWKAIEVVKIFKNALYILENLTCPTSVVYRFWRNDTELKNSILLCWWEACLKCIRQLVNKRYWKTRTVATRSSIRRLYVCAGGLNGVNLIKTLLIYSVSYFNLEAWCFV